jgi:hypothetical protein
MRRCETLLRIINTKDGGEKDKFKRIFPEMTLFSKMDPEGISILEPWLATIMTVP